LKKNVKPLENISQKIIIRHKDRFAKTTKK
jgi:hypothetical protein